MFEDKTNEELLALFACLNKDECKAQAGISNTDLTDCRKQLEEVRRELLKRLEQRPKGEKMDENETIKKLTLEIQIPEDKQICQNMMMMVEDLIQNFPKFLNLQNSEIWDKIKKPFTYSWIAIGPASILEELQDEIKTALKKWNVPEDKFKLKIETN